jgi:hypothetical protein
VPLAEWVLRQKIESGDAFGRISEDIYHGEWFLGKYIEFERWAKQAWPTWKWIKNEGSCDYDGGDFHDDD